ncbi:MAG: hypothetical protein R3C10_14765 [Pirellulales bacterium]|nr:hypothetical protein [Planctomycetales bacterium]
MSKLGAIVIWAVGMLAAGDVTPTGEEEGGAPSWLVTTLHGALDPVADAIKSHALAPLDRVLDAAPMWVAQACAVGLFVVAGLAVCVLRRNFVYLGAPDQHRWRDLRIWSLLLLLPYIAVYLVWGR